MGKLLILHVMSMAVNGILVYSKPYEGTDNLKLRKIQGFFMSLFPVSLLLPLLEFSASTDVIRMGLYDHLDIITSLSAIAVSYLIVIQTHKNNIGTIARILIYILPLLLMAAVVYTANTNHQIMINNMEYTGKITAYAWLLFVIPVTVAVLQMIQDIMLKR